MMDSTDHQGPVLEARNLEKHFGGLVAVAGVTLDVKCGEVHAVIGPNGAGKSTLVNLLAGDLRADAGSIHLDGHDVTRASTDRRALRGMGRSFQKTAIFPDLSAGDHVRLARQAQGTAPLTVWRHGDRRRADRTDALDILKMVGLADCADRRAGSLSHGEQRQLEMAMVLGTKPKLVLLDEPLAGMGQAESARMIALIRNLKSNRAVLLVEHDMDAVFALADRLTVMVDGAVIASGDPDEVRQQDNVRTAYLGTANTAL